MNAFSLFYEFLWKDDVDGLWSFVVFVYNVLDVSSQSRYDATPFSTFPNALLIGRVGRVKTGNKTREDGRMSTHCDTKPLHSPFISPPFSSVMVRHMETLRQVGEKFPRTCHTNRCI